MNRPGSNRVGQHDASNAQDAVSNQFALSVVQCRVRTKSRWLIANAVPQEVSRVFTA